MRPLHHRLLPGNFHYKVLTIQDLLLFLAEPGTLAGVGYQCNICCSTTKQSAVERLLFMANLIIATGLMKEKANHKPAGWG